jgi:hypothetical protein
LKKLQAKKELRKEPKAVLKIILEQMVLIEGFENLSD